MSSRNQVNLAKFSAMLRTKRGERGLRAIAEEIGGVSASTLSRIEQGNVPDLETFARICKWLGVAPNEFMADTKGSKAGTETASGENTPEMIETHLRADRVLPLETINALSEMIRVAYRAANEGKLGKTKK